MLPRTGNRRTRRGVVASVMMHAALLPALQLLWFVCVDRHYIYEYCDDCHSHRVIVQFRVLRLPVWARAFDTLVSEENTIATDLGRPCAHKSRRACYALTFRGLVCPSGPIPAFLAIGDRGWYDDATVRALKLWAKEVPGLPDEYHRKVIVEHNRDYLRSFVSELRRRAARERAPEKARNSGGG